METGQNQTRQGGQQKGKAAVKWFDFATSKNLSSVGDQALELGYCDEDFMFMHGVVLH